MLLLRLLFGCALLPALINAQSCSERTEKQCTNKCQRKAWHTLSDIEKKEYIDAELCLMDLPPRTDLHAVRSVFDELQACHQIQASWTHFVGAFLPYHRYLMNAHEYLLKTECGYTGCQPYWDEPRDAGNFSTSDVFDPVTGFGGDGSGNNSCITTGPFANYTNSIGPGYLVTDHCIDRKIDDNTTGSLASSQFEVDACNVYNTYDEAWLCIQGRPHLGGHAGTGGQMNNPISSPGDPVFYLHHTWLDKVWWDWQALNLSSRLYDISGSNYQPENTTLFDIPGGNGGKLGNGSYPAPPPYTGDPGNITTLIHSLSTLGIIPNATVGDVMDIGGGYLCYEYV